MTFQALGEILYEKDEYGEFKKDEHYDKILRPYEDRQIGVDQHLTWGEAEVRDTEYKY